MQENIKHKTPNGKELIVKGFLSARERNAIRAASVQDLNITEDGATSTDPIQAVELKAIKVMVVSYDGMTEGAAICDKLLDGDTTEYDFVAGKARELMKGTFRPAK